MRRNSSLLWLAVWALAALMMSRAANADGLNGTPNGWVGLFVNGATEALHITTTGNVGIGSTSPVSSLDLSQKTDALALPGGTTGQEPASPVNGMIRYNITKTALEAYFASAWNTISTSGNTPTAFSFTNQTGVSTNSTISSNAVTLSGFTGTVSATCGTNCTAIARNGSWGGTTVTGFASGDTIAIRLTSSASLNSAVNATVTAGTTVSGTWSVTTTASTPSAFNFTDVTGAVTTWTYCSNAVTLSGFTGTVTAVCNAGCTAIALNGVYSGTTVGGFVSGNTISICQAASSSASTPATASVTVGNTTSSTWTVTTGADTCPGVNTIGTTCPDGTVYAGVSLDGDVKVYVTPCDAGQSLSGSCTGTRTTETWNNGTTTYYTTGYTNQNTGKANTIGLNTIGTTSDSPYQAATYCATLSAFGHSDWYLPAYGEANNTINNAANSAAIGGFQAATTYWVSTELNNGSAFVITPSTGATGSAGNKNIARNIRCMRHI